MIADNLYKKIGQKLSVVKYHYRLDPKDWKTWPCEILISTLEKVYFEETPEASGCRRISSSEAIKSIR